MGLAMSAIGVTKPASTTVSRRSWSAVMVVFFVFGGVAWVGWTWWSARRYRSAMAEIDARMAAGRFGLAARNLEKLLAWSPSADEAAYVLGICEQARGRTREADQAWARVSPGSAFTQRAILARLRLFHDTGRLAAAEQVVIDAANDPRNDGTDLLVLLVPIYSQIGRSGEAERLVANRWEHLYAQGEATPEQSIKLVRVHMDLTWKAPSIEDLRLYLDQVGRAAPDDDRVWLGRADLAVRTGAYDEAKRWLDACQRRRPEDLAVWRVRLNLGIAANQIDVAREALKHVPAARSKVSEHHRVRAWFCSRRNDAECERKELESLVDADPADAVAIDRLAQLADKAGQPTRAAELRGKKAEIAHARDRYLKLYERTQHIRDAEEMAHLAEELGRMFEARVFLTLAISQEPEREDLRRNLQRLSRISTTVAQ
jgi:thioredoxin-like negative regulator of GroEL